MFKIKIETVFQEKSQSALLGRRVREMPILVGLRSKAILNFLSSLGLIKLMYI
jgi:hypothetical protein